MDEVAAAAGYSPKSVRAYKSLGYLASVIVTVSPGVLRACGVAKMDDTEFQRAISQSNKVKDIGYRCKNQLAKALTHKSRDNAILALSIYNNPTITNRIDGFAMLFCAAWEQLMKAMIIEENGESAIFKPLVSGRLRESIAFTTCLDSIFPQPQDRRNNDSTRKNLERLRLLRDEATHLLVHEIQSPVSRLFQACVLNYDRMFKSFAGTRFLPEVGPGQLILLYGETSKPSAINLQRLYGKEIGDEILNLFNTIERDIEEINDPTFAIKVFHKLVLEKEKGESKPDIKLTTLETANRDAVVVNRPKNDDELFPYFASNAHTEINRLLQEKLSRPDYEKRVKHSNRQSIHFNRHDFICIVDKLGWRNDTEGANGFHRCSKTTPKSVTHKYSQVGIEFIVEHIIKQDSYLHNARKSYAHKKRKTVT